MTQTEKNQTSGDDRALADFEQSLTELESLVESLETEDLGLEASLSKFERGVALARRCQSALKSAELKVRQLADLDSDGEPEAFEDDGDDAA